MCDLIGRTNVNVRFMIRMDRTIRIWIGIPVLVWQVFRRRSGFRGGGGGGGEGEMSPGTYF